MAELPVCLGTTLRRVVEWFDRNQSLPSAITYPVKGECFAQLQQLVTIRLGEIRGIINSA